MGASSVSVESTVPAGALGIRSVYELASDVYADEVFPMRDICVA